LWADPFRCGTRGADWATHAEQATGRVGISGEALASVTNRSAGGRRRAAVPARLGARIPLFRGPRGCASERGRACRAALSPAAERMGSSEGDWPFCPAVAAHQWQSGGRQARRRGPSRERSRGNAVRPPISPAVRNIQHVPAPLPCLPMAALPHSATSATVRAAASHASLPPRASLPADLYNFLRRSTAAPTVPAFPPILLPFLPFCALAPSLALPSLARPCRCRWNRWRLIAPAVGALLSHRFTSPPAPTS
jgi:hypothetical protein